MRVPPDIRAMVLSDNAVALLGTAGADRRPSLTVLGAPHVEEDGAVLSYAFSARLNPFALPDIRENPAVAISLTRAPECVSFQMKGRVLSIAPATAQDQAEFDAVSARLTQILWQVNPFAREKGTGFHMDVDHRVRIAIDAVFVQSPGPNAGSPVPA